MKPTPPKDNQDRNAPIGSAPIELISNDESLALHSMSVLAEEFALRPDFGHLLDLTIRTLGRQFGIEDAFVSIFAARSPEQSRVLYAAAGRFESNDRISRLASKIAPDDITGIGDQIDLSADITGSSVSDLLRDLRDSGVRFLSVMAAPQNPIGIIGLGRKSNDTALSPRELHLLRILTKTITPIIANAHVFGEMNAVRSWYASILNNVRQGVFVFDENFHLKMANIAGLRILESYLGSEPEARGWNGQHITDVFTNEKFPGWSDRIEAIGIIADTSRPFQLVAKNQKDRRVFTAHIASCSDWTTEELDVIVTVEDITAQKENEARLMQLERLADKGMMSSAIAHELNNFLGVILGGIDISLAAVERDDVDKRRERLEKLKDHAMTMRRFTAGLIDRHQLDTKVTLAQLNDIVTDVVAFTQVQKRFQNVNISYRLSQRLPQLKLDVNQMSQLLLNFLNNAADAIRDARRDYGNIVIRTKLEPNLVELSIADNGTGINEELRSKLFRENFTTKKTGHGYGLTTCMAILERHRAHIDYESTVGEGTTFRMSFPILPDENSEN